MTKIGPIKCLFAMWLSSVTMAVAADPAAIWPQWRGPTRDGQVEGDSEWPETLAGDAMRPVWSVQLGPSYSGPIVSESLVFTTETRDEQRETVRAFDRDTGEQRWKVEWDGGLSVPFFAKANGDWIRSTPAYDGHNLYVAGMRDVLVCLDALTGEEQWRTDFAEQLNSPLPSFGFVCSPLVDDDFVYVQAGAGCCKLDKRTGQILWRVLKDDGGMSGSAFSSPILGTLANRTQLLVQTRERLAGLDPESGEELWAQPIPAFRGMNILTPTIFDNSVFTSAYGGESLSFKLSNQDGTITASEEWSSNVTGYMSSPVVIDGHVYLHLQNQRFTCINVASGESRSTTQPFGKYWSLVANGDRILSLDERGELRLIRATPESYEELDQRNVSDDPTWAHLAVCGDQLFIRELNALTTYAWQK